METKAWLSLTILVLASFSVKKTSGLCTNNNKEVTCASISDVSSDLINQIPDIREVTRITIQKNNNLVISNRAFESAVNLRRIVITYNKINRINPSTFKNLPVTLLKLDYNNINFIFPGAFVNLPDLDKLRIAHNNLERIQPEVYINLPLTELTLSHNSISVIENMSFKDLPNLKKLRLDNNKLQSVVIHRILTYPNRLEILWLHNNSLNAITNYMLQDLGNLRLLNLGFNSISFVEPNSFEHTPKLHYLVLTNNNLKEVDGSIFPRTGMNYLENLYLDNNNLMFLPSSFFVRLGSLKKITLVGNPWLCACLTAVQKLLWENNIQEKCAEDYSSGARAVCVGDKDDNTECRHVYNIDLSEKYASYKRSYPLYRSTSCIL